MNPRELAVGTMVGAFAADSAADFGVVSFPAGMVIARSEIGDGLVLGCGERGRVAGMVIAIWSLWLGWMGVGVKSSSSGPTRKVCGMAERWEGRLAVASSDGRRCVSCSGVKVMNWSSKRKVMEGRFEGRLGRKMEASGSRLSVCKPWLRVKRPTGAESRLI